MTTILIYAFLHFRVWFWNFGTNHHFIARVGYWKVILIQNWPLKLTSISENWPWPWHFRHIIKFLNLNSMCQWFIFPSHACTKFFVHDKMYLGTFLRRRFGWKICYVMIYDVIEAKMNNSWYMIIVRWVSYRVRNNHCHFLLFFRVSLWYFFNLFFFNYLSNAIFLCNLSSIFLLCGILFSSSTFSTLDMFRTVAKTGPSVDLTPSCSPRWVLTLF